MNTRGARRIQPQGPSQAYQTFQVASPIATHYRSATCEEVDCQHWINGWAINGNALQEKDWHAIKQSKRKYTMDSEGWLIFEAGQPCFKASTHRVAIGRPEIYRIGRGDWRSYNSRNAQQVSTEEWLDRFRTNQDKLTTQLERG